MSLARLVSGAARGQQTEGWSRARRRAAAGHVVRAAGDLPACHLQRSGNCGGECPPLSLSLCPRCLRSSLYLCPRFCCCPWCPSSVLSASPCCCCCRLFLFCNTSKIFQGFNQRSVNRKLTQICFYFCFISNLFESSLFEITGHRNNYRFIFCLPFFMLLSHLCKSQCTFAVTFT